MFVYSFLSAIVFFSTISMKQPEKRNHGLAADFHRRWFFTLGGWDEEPQRWIDSCGKLEPSWNHPGFTFVSIFFGLCYDHLIYIVWQITAMRCHASGIYCWTCFGAVDATWRPFDPPWQPSVTCDVLLFRRCQNTRLRRGHGDSLGWDKLRWFSWRCLTHPKNCDIEQSTIEILAVNNGNGLAKNEVIIPE